MEIPGGYNEQLKHHFVIDHLDFQQQWSLAKNVVFFYFLSEIHVSELSVSRDINYFQRKPSIKL